jgi:hypothetical protein
MLNNTESKARRNKPKSRGNNENFEFSAVMEPILSPDWQAVKSWFENHGFWDASRNMAEIQKDYRNNGALALGMIRAATQALKTYRKNLTQNGSTKGSFLYVWE